MFLILKKSLKTIALALIFCLASEPLAFAAQDLPSAFTMAPQAIRFPKHIAQTGEYYSLSKEAPMVYLLEDAHTNYSGQKNLAAALELIFKKRGVVSVFTEAGFGNSSLSELRRQKEPEALKRFADSQLRQGILHGEEYLQLTHDADFTIWGVEEAALYRQAVELYRQSAENRSEFKTYLRHALAAAGFLEARIYRPDVARLIEQRRLYTAHAISFSDYFDTLLSMAADQGLSVSFFPALKDLKKLAKEEPRKAQRKLRRMMAGQVLDELEKMENEIFGALLRTEDEHHLFQTVRRLERLEKLFSLAMEPREFGIYCREKDRHDIQSITGYLNRKLAEFEGGAERAVLLKDSYEEAVKNAALFYELTIKRDEKFVENMLAVIASKAKQSRSNDPAILITGGFHTPHLKTLLREKGISYQVVTPQVRQETNQKRYETILLGQRFNFAAGTIAPDHLRTPSAVYLPSFRAAAARLPAKKTPAQEAMHQTSWSANLARLTVFLSALTLSSELTKPDIQNRPQEKPQLLQDKTVSVPAFKDIQSFEGQRQCLLDTIAWMKENNYPDQPVLDIYAAALSTARPMLGDGLANAPILMKVTLPGGQVFVSVNTQLLAQVLQVSTTPQAYAENIASLVAREAWGTVMAIATADDKDADSAVVNMNQSLKKLHKEPGVLTAEDDAHVDAAASVAISGEMFEVQKQLEAAAWAKKVLNITTTVGAINDEPKNWFQEMESRQGDFDALLTYELSLWLRHAVSNYFSAGAFYHKLPDVPQTPASFRAYDALVSSEMARGKKTELKSGMDEAKALKLLTERQSIPTSFYRPTAQRLMPSVKARLERLESTAHAYLKSKKGARLAERNRSGFGLAGGVMTSSEKTYQDLLERDLNHPDLKKEEKKALINTLVRSKDGFLKLRQPFFFTEEETVAILGYSLFNVKPFLERVIEEKRRYQSKTNDQNKPFFSPKEIQTLLFQKLIPLEWIEDLIKDGLSKTTVTRIVTRWSNPKETWNDTLKPLQDELVREGLSKTVATTIVTAWSNPKETWNDTLKPIRDELVREGVSVSAATTIVLGWSNPKGTWHDTLKPIRDELVAEGLSVSVATIIVTTWSNPKETWYDTLKPIRDELVAEGLSKTVATTIVIRWSNPKETWYDTLKPIRDELVTEGLSKRVATTIVTGWSNPKETWNDTLKPIRDELVTEGLSKGVATAIVTGWSNPKEIWNDTLKPIRDELVAEGLSKKDATRIVTSWSNPKETWNDTLKPLRDELVREGLSKRNATFIVITWSNPKETWYDTLKPIRDELVAEGLSKTVATTIVTRWSNPKETWCDILKPLRDELVREGLSVSDATTIATTWSNPKEKWAYIKSISTTLAKRTGLSEAKVRELLLTQSHSALIQILTLDHGLSLEESENILKPLAEQPDQPTPDPGSLAQAGARLAGRGQKNLGVVQRRLSLLSLFDGQVLLAGGRPVLHPEVTPEKIHRAGMLLRRSRIANFEESESDIERGVPTAPLIHRPELDELMYRLTGMHKKYYFYYLPALPEGSFKPYDMAEILDYFDRYPEKRALVRRIVAESTGNQGRAVTALVQKLKKMYPEDTQALQAVIFMPHEATAEKIRLIRQLGGAVVRHAFTGEELERYLASDEAGRQSLEEIAERQKRILADYPASSLRVDEDVRENPEKVLYVSHGGAWGVAGYANVGIEALNQWWKEYVKEQGDSWRYVPLSQSKKFLEKVSKDALFRKVAFVVPTGSGGLTAGIAQIKQFNERIRVFGTQAVGVDPMFESLAQDRMVDKSLFKFDSTAVRHVDGIAATPEPLTFEILRQMIDGMARVFYPDNDAMVRLVWETAPDVEMEPASVLPLTLMVKYGRRLLPDAEHIIIPVTGRITDPALRSEILQMPAHAAEKRLLSAAQAARLAVAQSALENSIKPWAITETALRGQVVGSRESARSLNEKLNKLGQMRPTLEYEGKSVDFWRARGLWLTNASLNDVARVANWTMKESLADVDKAKDMVVSVLGADPYLVIGADRTIISDLENELNNLAEEKKQRGESDSHIVILASTGVRFERKWLPGRKIDKWTCAIGDVPILAEKRNIPLRKKIETVSLGKASGAGQRVISGNGLADLVYGQKAKARWINSRLDRSSEGSDRGFLEKTIDGKRVRIEAIRMMVGAKNKKDGTTSSGVEEVWVTDRNRDSDLLVIGGWRRRMSMDEILKKLRELKVLPQRVAFLRQEAAGLGKGKLGKKIGVSQPIVGSWEDGRKEPSPKNLCRLAALFDIDPIWIYSGMPRDEALRRAGDLAAAAGMPNNHKNAVSMRIKLLRIATGLTQREFEEKNGLAPGALSRLETGAEPDPANYRKLAGIFGVDISTLHSGAPLKDILTQLPHYYQRMIHLFACSGLYRREFKEEAGLRKEAVKSGYLNLFQDPVVSKEKKLKFRQFAQKHFSIYLDSNLLPAEKDTVAQETQELEAQKRWLEEAERRILEARKAERERRRIERETRRQQEAAQKEAIKNERTLERARKAEAIKQERAYQRERAAKEKERRKKQEDLEKKKRAEERTMAGPLEKARERKWKDEYAATLKEWEAQLQSEGNAEGLEFVKKIGRYSYDSEAKSYPISTKGQKIPGLVVERTFGEDDAGNMRAQTLVSRQRTAAPDEALAAADLQIKIQEYLDQVAADDPDLLMDLMSGLNEAGEADGDSTSLSALLAQRTGKDPDEIESLLLGLQTTLRQSYLDQEREFALSQAARLASEEIRKGDLKRFWSRLAGTGFALCLFQVAAGFSGMPDLFDFYAFIQALTVFGFPAGDVAVAMFIPALTGSVADRFTILISDAPYYRFLPNLRFAFYMGIRAALGVATNLYYLHVVDRIFPGQGSVGRVLASVGFAFFKNVIQGVFFTSWWAGLSANNRFAKSEIDREKWEKELKQYSKPAQFAKNLKAFFGRIPSLIATYDITQNIVPANFRILSDYGLGLMHQLFISYMSHRSNPSFELRWFFAVNGLMPLVLFLSGLMTRDAWMISAGLTAGIGTATYIRKKNSRTPTKGARLAEGAEVFTRNRVNKFLSECRRFQIDFEKARKNLSAGMVISDDTLRDGIQGLKNPMLSPAQKIELVRMLSSVNALAEREDGSFVSPKLYPQMATTPDLLRFVLANYGGSAISPAVRYLLFNEQSWASLIDACMGADFTSGISVTASADPDYAVTNLGWQTSSDPAKIEKREKIWAGDILLAFREMTAKVLQLVAKWESENGKTLRKHAYVSGVPRYDGRSVLENGPNQKPFEQLLEGYALGGASVIWLSDTQGEGNPNQIRKVSRFVQTLKAKNPKFKNVEFGWHLHDGHNGLGMVNFLAAAESGITRFDFSLGGTGGSKGASVKTRNASLEDACLIMEALGVANAPAVEQLIPVIQRLEEFIGEPLGAGSNAWQLQRLHPSQRDLLRRTLSAELSAARLAFSRSPRYVTTSIYSPLFLEAEKKRAERTKTIAFDLDHTLAVFDSETGDYRLRQGVEALLQKLKMDGFRLVLWTASFREKKRKQGDGRRDDFATIFFEQHSHLAEYFDWVVTHENFGINFKWNDSEGKWELEDIMQLQRAYNSHWQYAKAELEASLEENLQKYPDAFKGSRSISVAIKDPRALGYVLLVDNLQQGYRFRPLGRRSMRVAAMTTKKVSEGSVESAEKLYPKIIRRVGKPQTSVLSKVAYFSFWLPIQIVLWFVLGPNLFTFPLRKAEKSVSDKDVPGAAVKGARLAGPRQAIRSNKEGVIYYKGKVSLGGKFANQAFHVATETLAAGRRCFVFYSSKTGEAVAVRDVSNGQHDVLIVDRVVASSGIFRWHSLPAFQIGSKNSGKLVTLKRSLQQAFTNDFTLYEGDKKMGTYKSGVWDWEVAQVEQHRKVSPNGSFPFDGKPYHVGRYFQGKKIALVPYRGNNFNTGFRAFYQEKGMETRIEVAAYNQAANDYWRTRAAYLLINFGIRSEEKFQERLDDTVLQGERLRLLRLADGESQEHLAKHLGIGKRTIGEIENHRWPMNEKWARKLNSRFRGAGFHEETAEELSAILSIQNQQNAVAARLASFLFGVSVAHASDIKRHGARLAVGRTVYELRIEKSGPVAYAHGQEAIHLRDFGRFNGDSLKGLSLSDMQLLVDQNTRSIADRLEKAGLEEIAKPVTLGVDLAVFNNENAAENLNMLLIELVAYLKRVKGAEFVRVQFHGPKKLVRKANREFKALTRGRDFNKHILTVRPLGIRVVLTASDSRVARHAINLPWKKLQNNEVAAIRSALLMAIAAAQVDPDHIPDNFYSAFQTLAGTEVSRDILRKILKGEATSDEMEVYSIKPLFGARLADILRLYDLRERQLRQAA